MGGKGLSSIGDLLMQIAIVSEIKTKPTEGLSAGGGELTPAFGGDFVPDVKEITKVNGLCDEYYKVRANVDGAWPYGLGKYLLMKLSASIAVELSWRAPRTDTIWESARGSDRTAFFEMMADMDEHY